MKRLQLLLIPLSLLLLSACATQPMSDVHRISDGQYLVQMSYSLSEGSDTTAKLVLESLASNACQGDYEKTKQWLFPDPYWDEIIVYWEISCGMSLQHLTQNSTRSF